MNWTIRPQTEVKHKLLTEYLGRWIPILAQRRPQGERIVYVDGFAGPGRYAGGEMGSPLLALKVALEHRSLRGLLSRGEFEMVFIFIEMEPATHQRLRSELKDFLSQVQVPRQLRVFDPVLGEFREQMSQILGLLEEQRERLAPSFVFVDPFGPLGFPFQTVIRLMQNAHCEAFIRFNYTRLANNFLARREMESRIDDLYGSSLWRQAKALNASEREKFLVELYIRQLREAGGVGFVQSFKTVDPTGHIAHFIFATNSSRGFEEMKESMWKVEPDGLFLWRASVQKAPEQTSFTPHIAHAECENELMKRLPIEFGGKRVPVTALEEFVRRQPILLIRHLRPALRGLEASNKMLNVSRPSGAHRKKGTFPPDSLVTLG